MNIGVIIPLAIFLIAIFAIGLISSKKMAVRQWLPPRLFPWRP